MANIYTPSPEELGRRRFPDNKDFRKTLTGTANDILTQMQDLLASNYPEDFSTNLNIFNKVMAREIARLNLSINAINDDKDYILTRPQYLQQILGERFFLGSRIAPIGYNDESYRNYLLSIKSANLKGSKKSTLEALASEFTGQTVNIKELYLEARRPFSALGVTDANKMIVQVLIDNLLQPGQNINVLKDNLDFFINLVRPAHVLYDTELIWLEQINVNKIFDVIFGDTGGGCIPAYQSIPFEEPTILALTVRVIQPGGTYQDTKLGYVEAVHNADFIFYLDDSTRVITEPGYEGTKIYDINGRQILLNNLEVGSYVSISYQVIPGSFQFWNYPSEILTTPYSQYYRDIYRLPLFQETVKKYMDAQGRFPLQIKTTPTTVCDRWVQDALQPLYEDLRGNCKSGREHLTSDNQTITDEIHVLTFDHTEPLNLFAVDSSSILISNITKSINYTGDGTDYSIIPGTSTTATQISITVGGRINDDQTSLISYTAPKTLRKHSGYPKLYWPFPSNEIHDPALLGSDFIQFMEHYPLTDGSSNPATPSDISVAIDGTALTGSISSVDATSGRIYLNDTTAYWWPALGHYPINGEELTFNYKYLDGTTNLTATTQTVFGISYWQLNKIPILKGDSSGTLADSTNVTVTVDGTVIPQGLYGPIVGFEPLLGHVILSPYSDFWTTSALGRIPVAGDGTTGDAFKFSYYWGENYDYGLLFDDPARLMDTYAGASDPYGMFLDGGEGLQPIPADDPLEIGYRYRMYLLQHSSVLNSPGTLNLNEYQKPGNKASIANQMAVLNHYNKIFSPEFLYDTNPLPARLDDPYLDSTLVSGQWVLDPVLKLNAGTPPFQKTFSYQPNLIYQKKLQDIRTNHKLLLYSDLLLKEFRTGSDAINLSSICDSNRVTFKFRYKENLNPIKECSPWIIFDTVEFEGVSLDIPGEYKSVPNLRISTKHLRENFILRGVETTGTAEFSYSFITPSEAAPSTTFNLPATYKFFLNDYWVDFPTIPIVDFYGDTATIADISCTINGQPHTVTGLNPATGLVTIADYNVTQVIGEIFTLTAENIFDCEITLPGYITDPQNAEFTIIQGGAQFVYKDFKVSGQHVIWYFSELKELLQVGDQIRISYTVTPVNTTIEFTYHIINSAIIPMINRDLSRIMDDKYVFGGLCYDQEGMNLGVFMNEYYGYLDDGSDGIKISFFNKDTLTIEDHIFSGPVFESYIAVEDEIGVPENFPNALVRIANPLSLNNPLNYAADYGFLNDQLVRFRKKTYQELLPDRSFRILKLTEMLPI